MQFDNLTPSDIESVSGQVLTNNVFILDANGTEAGQSQAVIPLFDSDNTVGSQEVSITVTLVGSKTPAAVGTAPFNPFMVVNGVRANEIHLSKKATTDLAIRHLL